ncbi:ROK family protein, partial [Cellulomonas septica]|nr:ROK family protein [Cellulomonas septica]
MDVRVRSGGWSVGLDIGGSKVLGVVLDPSGAVRHQVKAGTVRGLDGVVAGAVAAVEELAGLAGVAVGDLVGVGLGLPGVVDVVAGTVEHAVNLGIDERVALAALVADRLGPVPVRLENDLNAAVVGAARFVEPHADGAQHDLAFL